MLVVRDGPSAPSHPRPHCSVPMWSCFLGLLQPLLLMVLCFFGGFKVLLNTALPSVGWCRLTYETVRRSHVAPSPWASDDAAFHFPCFYYLFQQDVHTCVSEPQHVRVYENWCTDSGLLCVFILAGTNQSQPLRILSNYMFLHSSIMSTISRINIKNG